MDSANLRNLILIFTYRIMDWVTASTKTIVFFLFFGNAIDLPSYLVQMLMVIKNCTQKQLSYSFFSGRLFNICAKFGSIQSRTGASLYFFLVCQRNYISGNIHLDNLIIFLSLFYPTRWRIFDVFSEISIQLIIRKILIYVTAEK